MKHRRILALAAAVMILLTGCRQAEGMPPVTEPEASTPAVSQTLPAEPATQPAEQPTEPSQPETEPAVALHSGIREDGSFDEGTLFIGDSLTYGLVLEYLEPNGLLGEARYIAMPGAVVSVFFTGPSLRTNGPVMSAYSPEFEGLTMSEAVAVAADDVTAVYYMMGTNYSRYVTTDTYIEIVSYLLETCPEATIYLQLVPLSRSAYVAYGKVNQQLSDVYQHFSAQREERVMLIDTYTAIGANLIHDGIHLTAAGQACWYDALVAFAEENRIPQ